jgi:voltage-gated potassium channel
MIVLALLWLVIFAIPYAAALPSEVAETLAVADYCVWAVFVVEYLVKLYLAPSRAWFVRHHLVDLAVIALPLFRPLRAGRLLRVGRAGVILASALRRAQAIATHRGLHYLLLAVFAIIVAGAALALGFENHADGSRLHDFGDALWWAIVTTTTVGYGDLAPVTAGGRGIAVALMLVGIGMIGVLTATVASYFVEDKTSRDKADLEARLDRIETMLATALGSATDDTD